VWRVIRGILGSGALLILGVWLAISFSLREVQEYPIPSRIFIGTPLRELDGRGQLPLSRGAIVRLEPGQSVVRYRFLYAEHGVRSEYVVIAFGSKATISNVIQGSTPGPAVFRGYRPIGGGQRRTCADGPADDIGTILLWRQFELDTQRGAEERARKLVERYRREGFEQRPCDEQLPPIPSESADPTPSSD